MTAEEEDVIKVKKILYKYKYIYTKWRKEKGADGNTQDILIKNLYFTLKKKEKIS